MDARGTLLKVHLGLVFLYVLCVLIAKSLTNAGLVV